MFPSRTILQPEIAYQQTGLAVPWRPRGNKRLYEVSEEEKTHVEDDEVVRRRVFRREYK